MTITEFLLERIAEDERTARDAITEQVGWRKGSEETWPDPATNFGLHMVNMGGLMIGPARVLADCEAKRRIVEKAQRADQAFTQHINPASSAASFALTEVLHYLALPYADHPDYQPEWKL